jgi:hypothetical protein
MWNGWLRVLEFNAKAQRCKSSHNFIRTATPKAGSRFKWSSKKLMKKYLQTILQYLALFSLLATLSCSAFQTVQIVPVFDPEATILQQSGGVIHVKNGITAIAAPLNDVKAVDAFGIVIYNGTDHFVSFKKKDCWMLDQAQNKTKVLDRSEHSFFLGKNFKPKMPPGFPVEVFRSNKAIRMDGPPVALPQEDIETTTIMPRRRVQFYLYFRKRSIKSSQLRIIIPKVYSEFDDVETPFVFKFEVRKN